MSIIRDALEYLVERGREAKPDIFTTDREAKHRYFLRIGDELKQLDADPAPVNRTALSLGAVADVLANHTAATTISGGKDNHEPEAWYSEKGVVGRFGPHRRESITLPLAVSKPFQTLRAWADGSAWLDQQQILTSFRTTFANCLSRHPELVGLLSNLRLLVQKETTGDVGVARSSVGKSLKAEATGLDSAPGEITLVVPPFANPGLGGKCDIKCAFIIDPVEGRFRVQPLPGELESAMAMAEQAVGGELATLLREAGAVSVPVRHGHPG